MAERCDTLGTVQELSRTLHPTGLVVAGSVYAGVLCGALIIITGAAVLGYAALMLLKRFDEDGDGILTKEEIRSSCLRYIPVLRDTTAIDYFAIFRYPDVVLMAVYFLYQGASYSSLRMLASGQESTLSRMVGAFGATILGVFVVWTHRAVRRGLTPLPRRDLPDKGPQVRARVRPWDEPKPPQWLQWAVLSEQGDWVSCRRSKHWLMSWETAVRYYRAEHAATGIAVEMGAMWLLSLASAHDAAHLSVCGHIRVASAVVHFLQLVYCVWWRPYRSRRDNILRALTQLFIVISLIVLAIGFYDASGRYRITDPAFAPAGAGVAEIILLLATVACLLQLLTRGIAEVVLLIKGWRASGQTLEWTENGDISAPTRESSREADALPVKTERTPSVVSQSLLTFEVLSDGAANTLEASFIGPGASFNSKDDGGASFSTSSPRMTVSGRGLRTVSTLSARSVLQPAVRSPSALTGATRGKDDSDDDDGSQGRKMPPRGRGRVRRVTPVPSGVALSPLAPGSPGPRERAASRVVPPRRAASQYPPPAREGTDEAADIDYFASSSPTGIATAVKRVVSIDMSAEEAPASPPAALLSKRQSQPGSPLAFHPSYSHLSAPEWAGTPGAGRGRRKGTVVAHASQDSRADVS